MKKTVKLLALALCLLLCISMFAGCAKKEEAVRVTVNEVTHSVFYAPQYVALNEGFFKENGIDIELSTGEGTDKVMAAVLSGSIDIGFGGPEASIYVYNEGKEDYSQMFAQITKRDGSFLVAREKDDNFDWSKLEGKHVLPGRKGGVPYMTLRYVINQHGLNPDTDMNFDDSIQFSMMAPAFAAGTGDYVTIFEPTATVFENEGKGYIVASVGEDSGEIPYTGYFASKSYLEKNADTVQKFVNAVYKGQQWVKEHTAREVAESIAPSFPDTDVDVLETVVQRYKDIDAWNDTPVMKAESFDKLQTVMMEAGELEESEKVPFEEMINNSFAEKAVAGK